MAECLQIKVKDDFQVRSSSTDALKSLLDAVNFAEYTRGTAEKIFATTIQLWTSNECPGAAQSRSLAEPMSKLHVCCTLGNPAGGHGVKGCQVQDDRAGCRVEMQMTSILGLGRSANGLKVKKARLVMLTLKNKKHEMHMTAA